MLLVNLGTPDSPQTRDVRRYLRQFLSDPRVLDMPALNRWLLLNLIILPLRSRRSAEAYTKIWSAEGSPLLIHGRALRERVARELGPEYVVELAMRYGSPSVAAALKRLEQDATARLIVVPLFPQFSEAATGSALAHVDACLAGRWGDGAALTVRSFCEEPAFIAALAGLARPLLRDFRPDHVLLSYHGLPESQLRRSDAGSGHGCLERPDCCEALSPANRECYRAQCFATSRALIRALELRDGQVSTSFQSRMGRTPWIRPYTDEIVARLAERGVKRLAVLCPAFVADCLETLEEIGLRLREQWRTLGGEDLLLCPCPNAEPAWAAGVAELVRARATQR